MAGPVVGMTGSTSRCRRWVFRPNNRIVQPAGNEWELAGRVANSISGMVIFLKLHRKWKAGGSWVGNDIARPTSEEGLLVTKAA